MKRRDAVVVGAGVMGLASARALRSAGRDVVVLEQFEVGTPRASSHGSTRVFRAAYDDPAWVPVVEESLRLWRELEAETGREILSPTGFLDTGRDPAVIQRALDEAGTAYEFLTAGDVEHRFGITLAGAGAVLDPGGGFMWAGRALAALREGLEVMEGTRVVGLRQCEAGVSIETAAGRLEATIAVVAAGPWSPALLARAGIRLPVRVTRETVAFFALPNDTSYPAVADWSAPGGRSLHFALPAGGGLLKAGLHFGGVVADPDHAGAPDPAVVSSVSEWVSRVFPAADPGPVRAETCFYTSTADEGFVLERHGAIVVCSACSGHGFKFAPAVGTRVAALA